MSSYAIGRRPHVQAVTVETMLGQRQERFAVRLLVERDAAVATDHAWLLDRRRQVEVALGAEKEPIALAARASNDAKKRVEL